MIDLQESGSLGARGLMFYEGILGMESDSAKRVGGKYWIRED